MPWYELSWVQIMGAGCLGGLVSTFLPTGTSVPFSALVHELLGKRKKTRLACHISVNTLFGGLAGFAIWADYNAGALFSSGVAQPHEIATSLIVGGAGVSIINGLVKQHQDVTEARHEAVEADEDRTNWKEAYEDALEVARELQATLSDLGASQDTDEAV